MHLSFRTVAAAIVATAVLVIASCNLLPAASPLEGGGWKLSGTMSEEITLPEGTTFTVTDDFAVEATLTIEPGVTLEFAQGTRIRVNSDGTLLANGTADAPITLTATQKTPGWWYGIHVYSSDSRNNRMDYIIVEYGGRDAMHSSVEAANLAVGRSLRNAGVEITNANSTTAIVTEYMYRRTVQ